MSTLEPPPRDTLVEQERGAQPVFASRTWSNWFRRIPDVMPRAKTVTINPTAVSANTTSAQAFTVPGVTAADAVFVTKGTATTGLVVSHAYVSDDNEVTIVFGNLTGSPIDPASETYSILAVRI